MAMVVAIKEGTSDQCKNNDRLPVKASKVIENSSKKDAK
jgi:hypothetical protein